MAQLQALAREELQARVGPQADLRSMERAAQAIGRELWGGALSAELQQRCAAQPAGQCRRCGGRLRLVDAHRPRRLQGVVAPLQYARPYYVCGACGRSVAPGDQALGIGRGAWTPALQAAAACLGVEAPFAEAAAALTEALGIPVPPEGVRRTTEALGMVAEAEEQARIAEVERGQEEPGTAPVDSETLWVTLDGCAVHADGAWHEAQVGSVSTLGPGRAPGGEGERRPLRLGPQHDCVGVCEDAERFWRRLYALAVAWGLGGRRIRRVVVVADGAPWIWNRVEAFLGLNGVEVIPIVDLWHARQRIWEVAHAVFGEDSAQARAWAEPLSLALAQAGPDPVLRALREVPARTEAARHCVANVRAYFQEHAVRMDYPRFAAAGLPLGSGTVESACKLVVGAREKQAGMRWSRPGAQAVATLRARKRSGRWEAFWATRPQERRPRVRTLPGSGARAA